MRAAAAAAVLLVAAGACAFNVPRARVPHAILPASQALRPRACYHPHLGACALSHGALFPAAFSPPAANPAAARAVRLAGARTRVRGAGAQGRLYAGPGDGRQASGELPFCPLAEIQENDLQQELAVAREDYRCVCVCVSVCLSLSFSFALRCTLHMIVLDCVGQVDFIDHPTQLFQPNTSSPLRSITPPTVSSPLTFAVI